MERTKPYKNLKDVVDRANFSDLGTVIQVESGLVVPISIHHGSGNGVVGFKVDGGGLTLIVNVPPDGSGYRDQVTLTKESIQKLRELLDI